MNPIDLALKIIRNEAEELWRNGDVVEEDKEYMFGEALATVVSGMVDRIDGSCSEFDKPVYRKSMLRRLKGLVELYEGYEAATKKRVK